MTSASENPAIQGVRALTEEVRQYLGDGNPLLTGPCTVTLSMGVLTAVTPETAAKMMTLEMIENGLNVFTFEVTDDQTGDTYFVRDGQVYNQAELEEQLEAMRAAQGDGTP